MRLNLNTLKTAKKNRKEIAEQFLQIAEEAAEAKQTAEPQHRPRWSHEQRSALEQVLKIINNDIDVHELEEMRQIRDELKQLKSEILGAKDTLLEPPQIKMFD